MAQWGGGPSDAGVPAMWAGVASPAGSGPERAAKPTPNLGGEAGAGEFYVVWKTFFHST